MRLRSLYPIIIEIIDIQQISENILICNSLYFKYCKQHFMWSDIYRIQDYNLLSHPHAARELH